MKRLVMAILVGALVGGAANGLEIQLQLPRPECRVGEPVPVRIVLTNDTATEVTLQADFRGLVCFDVGFESEELRPLEHAGWVWGGEFAGPGLNGYQRVLAAGASLLLTESLLVDGSPEAAKREQGRFYAFPEPGRYRLRANLTQRRNPVTSPTVELTVLPPAPGDVVVWEGLRQIESYPSLVLAPIKLAQLTRFFRDTAQGAGARQPETLAYCSRMLQSTVVVSQVSTLLDRYPNSWYAGSMALSLARYLSVAEPGMAPKVAALYEQAGRQRADPETQATALYEWMRTQGREKIWVLSGQALQQFPTGHWATVFGRLRDEYAPSTPTQQAEWELKARGYTIVFTEELSKRYQQEVLGPVDVECKQKGLVRADCERVLAQRHRAWLEANMTPPAGDITPPVLTLLGANPVTLECGGVYADAGATATDNKDGDITSRIQVENNVDTPKAGTYQVIYRVTDAAGNAATATRTVKVVYKFDGFLAPIAGADAAGGTYDKPVKAFKLGSTVPVKFKISCGGAPVKNGTHSLQVIKQNNATTAAEPVDATPADAATSGNQFKLTGDEWHFNLDTKATGMIAGTWQLKATLADGSTHTVWLELK